MSDSFILKPESNPDWHLLINHLGSLLSSEDHPITTLANTAAFIFHSVGDLNWAGFYLFDGSELYLGPFAGKPACTRIPLGKGVCGTAAKNKETIVVADVNLFDGHIVCDDASRSEIVVPIVLSDGTLYGVLDIDSPIVNRFGENEKQFFERVRDIIVKTLNS